ncbi:hypothetical protein CsSME_00004299 [Camellia sinensis var. sinensis]
MKKNCVLLFCIVFFLVSGISVECHNQTFNVLDFGAVGDGSTDDTQSFEDAWKATCSAREVSGFSPTIHVPDGYEFLLQPLIFSGPCNSEAVNVVIDGNLTAPSHPSKWKCDGSNCRQWIGFVEINGLYIYGSGTINAQDHLKQPLNIKSFFFFGGS